jgi:hypothetical protein
MIRICVDAGPSHIQGTALAAALKKVFHPEGRKKGACFSCEKQGHFARECQNKTQPQLGILGSGTRQPTAASGPRARPPTQVMSLVSERKTLGKQMSLQNRYRLATPYRAGNLPAGLPWPHQTVGQSSCRLLTNTHH